MNTISFLNHWARKESPEKALERLTERFGIVVKQYDDRVVLNYSQINSPKLDPVVMECRGLILSYPDFKIMSRTFDRFFNYSETFDTLDFPFEKSIILEKIDGSLCPMYFDGKFWNVATRGMAFAEGETPMGNTFNKLFCKAIGIGPDYHNAATWSVNSLMTTALSGYEDYTFIFEMCSPETRVVKSYGTEPVVYLLAVRNKISGAYMPPNSIIHLFDGFNVQLPQIYPLKSLEEIQVAVNELENLDEGFVCYHPTTGRRVKIKSPQYLIYHRMNNNGVMTPKRALEILLINEQDEFLAVFPEWTKLFDDLKESIEIIKSRMIKTWHLFKNIEFQKDFALAIQDKPYASVLFKARAKNVDPLEIFESLEVNQKLKIVGP